MKRYGKWLFAAALALFLAIALVRTLSPRQRASADADDQAVKTPSRVSIQNGLAILTLDAATQSQAGLAVDSLPAFTSRAQLAAPATVLSSQQLVTARASYIAALASSEKASASRDVTREEFNRLSTLFADHQNASQKQLQAARAAMLSAQAEADSARQLLSLQSAATAQSWGPVVAAWVPGPSPAFESLLSQHAWLVQVTLPPGALAAAPPAIALQLSSAVSFRATLLSAFPRVDPRLQGISFLYISQAHPGLAPGLNLLARLPAGPPVRGVLIPLSAIVWWRGDAWAYQQTAPQRFVRRLVPTGAPLPNGFFVSSGFSPGDRIVVRGAQALLSEEFRSQIQAED